MSQQIKNESPFFHIVCDEDRAELFQIMFSVMVDEWHGFAHAHPDRAEHLSPCIKELVQEVSDKIHEHGWCKDPNCHL